TQLIISVVGQALLAQRLGRKTLVTSTIDGRRGLATASIAARLGLEAVVFMDNERNSRHTSNVFRMWLLGANVMPVTDERGGAQVLDAQFRPFADGVRPGGSARALSADGARVRFLHRPRVPAPGAPG